MWNSQNTDALPVCPCWVLVQNVSNEYIYEIGQLVRRYDVTITQPAADRLQTEEECSRPSLPQLTKENSSQFR